MNSALAAASLSCSDTFETVPFPLEGIASPLGLDGEIERRRRVGGDGERSRGTGVRDLLISILYNEQECIDLPFPFGRTIWTRTSRRGSTGRWRTRYGGRPRHVDLLVAVPVDVDQVPVDSKVCIVSVLSLVSMVQAETSVIGRTD